MDARLSLSRIRKQRRRDWLGGETSRRRDRGTSLNKQRSGWWCRKCEDSREEEVKEEMLEKGGGGGGGNSNRRRREEGV